MPVLVGGTLCHGWGQQLRGVPQLLPLEQSKPTEVEPVLSVAGPAPEEPPIAEEMPVTGQGGEVERGVAEEVASVDGNNIPPADSANPTPETQDAAVPVEKAQNAPPAVAQVNTGGAAPLVEDVTEAKVPYSSVFRGTGGPVGSNLFSGSRDPLGLGLNPSLGVGNSAQENAKVGEGDARITADLPSVQLGFPNLPYTPFLHRGFAPEDAHLKLGPIYVRFGEAMGALLASDNVNLDAVNREAGCIAVVRLGLTVVAQLTEGWQFAVSGLISYLPFTGKVGVDVTSGLDTGFGSFLLGVDYAPLLKSQLSYQVTLGDWPLVFADEAQINRGWYANETRDDFYRFNGRSSIGQYEDRAGRYVFAAPYTRFRTNSFFDRQRNGSFKQDNFDLTYLSNVVSVATSRLLPNEVQASARAYREDLWFYNNGNQGDSGLPHWREVATVELNSQRENLRFKPFMGYEVVKTSQMDSGVDQDVYVGVRGPITDQLSLYSKISLARGYTGEEGVFWNVRLDHQIGPYTTESLSYERRWTEFHDEIVQELEYRLRQILGPDLIGTFYAAHGRIENRFGQMTSAEDTRLGLLLTYDMSPRTQMNLGATFAQTDNNQDNTTVRTWTARYDINYHATDALTARLLYQYQKTEVDQANSDYYENMVMLMLTKTFR